MLTTAGLKELTNDELVAEVLDIHGKVSAHLHPKPYSRKSRVAERREWRALTGYRAIVEDELHYRWHVLGEKFPVY